MHNEWPDKWKKKHLTRGLNLRTLNDNYFSVKFIAIFMTSRFQYSLSLLSSLSSEKEKKSYYIFDNKFCTSKT